MKNKYFGTLVKNIFVERKPQAPFYLFVFRLCVISYLFDVSFFLLEDSTLYFSLHVLKSRQETAMHAAPQECYKLREKSHVTGCIRGI